MQQSNQMFKPIVLEELITQHAPSFAPWVPKMVLNRLSSLLHLDEINTFLSEHFHDGPLEFVASVVEFLELKLKTQGQTSLKDIPTNRPIIVANHPLGGPESLVMMHAVGKIDPKVKMVSKAILGELKPLKPLLIPIPTWNQRALVGQYRQAFNSDMPIIMFPAGYCSRPLSNKVIFDLKWYSSFVRMARVYNRPILPVHIDGANSNKFYRLSSLRRALRIKVSFESLYLPDEMFKQRGKTITLSCGQLIEPNQLPSDLSDDLLADRIRSYVYLLGQDNQRQFDATEASVLPLS